MASRKIGFQNINYTITSFSMSSLPTGYYRGFWSNGFSNITVVMKVDLLAFTAKIFEFYESGSRGHQSSFHTHTVNGLATLGALQDAGVYHHDLMKDFNEVFSKCSSEEFYEAMSKKNNR